MGNNSLDSMNNQNLDKDFMADIERLNLKLVHVIYSNNRKRRYTVIVENRGNLNVLKWNHPRQNLHLDKLKKEIIFYKQNKSKEYIPNIIYAEENLILIEYLLGKTFREWIIDYRTCIASSEDNITKEFKKVIDGVIEYISNFYVNFEGVVNEDEAISSLRIYFDKLYSSVSMSIPRNKIENLLLRINKIICERSIEKNFKKIRLQLDNENIKLKRYKIHSDLHLNNILVTEKDLRIKMIDWENITTGTILVDLNYLYSFIMFLLEGLPNHQKYVCSRFDEFFNQYDPELREIFFNVSNLFSIGISVNRSFGYKLSLNNFIKELWSFHSKSNKY